MCTLSTQLQRPQGLHNLRVIKKANFIRNERLVQAKYFWGPQKNPIPKIPPSFGLWLGSAIVKLLGTVWGWGQLKFWKFLGVYPRKNPNFEARGAVTYCYIFGDGFGMGRVKISGILWGKLPKNIKIRVGGGGKKIGDFPHTNLHFFSLLFSGHCELTSETAFF